jgi:hypothetical protein
MTDPKRYLLIDDLRDPERFGARRVARTSDDAILALTGALWDRVYFDNDLGTGQKEGWEIVSHLMHRVSPDMWPREVAVVSDNPPARRNMESKFANMGYERSGEDYGQIIWRRPTETMVKGAADGSESLMRWFGRSKVVDAQGRPLRVYHGTQRPDRLGTKFTKSRATSGPMPYFTDDPNIASNYATGKRDTSIEPPEDYGEWFGYRPKGSRKPLPIQRAWWHLTDEERAKISRNLPHVTNVDAEGNEISGYRLGGPDEYGLSNKDHWGTLIQRAHGNVLEAAKEMWLSSGSLFDSEEDFMDILRTAGMDMARVSYESPWAEYPGVAAVYLKIENPLETSRIPPNVVEALERAAGRTRKAPQQYGADTWDKSVQKPREWIDKLKEDIKKNTSYVWTSVPDWVTKALKSLGYDGIKDSGGKYAGMSHTVWLPFEESQVKSAIGNVGAYDPSKKDIRHVSSSMKVVLAYLSSSKSEFEKQASEDEQYMEAVSQNNLMAAQRMVNQAADRAGYKIEAYHGSSEEHITDFKEQHTAFGFFFSPDSDTADYYKGSDHGGKLYHVRLRMNKTLDLTDDVERWKFWVEKMSSGKKIRIKENERYGIKQPVSSDDIIQYVSEQYFKDERVKKALDDTGKMADESDGGRMPETPELVSAAIQFGLNVIDEDDLVKAVPFLEEVINEEFPEMDEDAISLEENYGSQQFYIEYQDDVMQTAVNNGYDSVIFDDPSSTGQQISYVVFDSNQIKSAEPITKDNKGNVIPLSKRFKQGSHDIRYATSAVVPSSAHLEVVHGGAVNRVVQAFDTSRMEKARQLMRQVQVRPLKKMELPPVQDVSDKNHHALAKKLEEAYERGAPQSEIDRLETDLARIVSEEDLDVSEDVMGGNIAEQLSSLYAEYLNPTGRYSREELLNIMRGTVGTEFAALYQPLKPGITDDQILEAAKDAYENRKGHIDKYRSKILKKASAENAETVKKVLMQRGVRGDRLLDAIDLMKDMATKGGKFTDYGNAILYHGTSPESAEAIMREQAMTSKEDGLFFGTLPDGEVKEYGPAVVEVEVPLERLEPSDEFPNEYHVHMPTGTIGKKIPVKVRRVVNRGMPNRSKAAATRCPLEFLGQDNLGYKYFFMDVHKDRFVHFTTRKRALEILESGKLLLDAPHKKFGAYGVFAVSLTYGEIIPGVALSHVMKWAKEESSEAVAVEFETDTVPKKAGFHEEVSWGEQDVALKDPRIVNVMAAIQKIGASPCTIDDKSVVIYDKALLGETKLVEEQMAKRASDESAWEAYNERYRDALNEAVYNIINNRPPKKLMPLNTSRLKKIWQDYARMGIVRDERGVDDILDDFLEKTVRIDVNNYLSGHASADPMEEFKQNDIPIPKDIDDRIDVAIADINGHWMISDYGIEHLQKLLNKAMTSSDYEQKLLALDGMLNVVHQRSDLASWFVQGGRGALQELSSNNDTDRSRSANRIVQAFLHSSMPNQWRWGPASDVPIYKDPIPSDISEIMKEDRNTTVRVGFDDSGDSYAWDGKKPHASVAKYLRTNWSTIAEYDPHLSTATLFVNSGEQEDAERHMPKIEKMFPKLRKIETAFGDYIFDTVTGKFVMDSTMHGDTGPGRDFGIVPESLTRQFHRTARVVEAYLKQAAAPYYRVVGKDVYIKHGEVPDDVWERFSRAMKSLGFDWRGGEDAKEMIGRWRTTDGETLLHGDHAQGFLNAVGKVDLHKPKAGVNVARVLQAAKRKFGTTENITAAGYIMPDGDLLNFGSGFGGRQEDHRIVGEILPKSMLPDNYSGYDAILAFCSMGPIRMHLSSNVVSFDVYRRPTSNQLGRIEDIIARESYKPIVIHAGSRDEEFRAGDYEGAIDFIKKSTSY